MTCRAGCRTPGQHDTWGACARAADIQIDRHALSNDMRLERRKDASLARYRDMRRSGLQPEAPTKTEMDKAEVGHG